MVDLKPVYGLVRYGVLVAVNMFIVVVAALRIVYCLRSLVGSKALRYFQSNLSSSGSVLCKGDSSAKSSTVSSLYFVRRVARLKAVWLMVKCSSVQ